MNKRDETEWERDGDEIERPLKERKMSKDFLAVYIGEEDFGI